MKTCKWSAITMAIAGSCVIGAAAQTSNQAQRGNGAAGDITVTGCLRDSAAMNGAGTSTATAGSAASTTASSYVLTNAIVGTSGSATASSETATTTGAAATGTTGSKAGMGTTYILDGHESDLKKHVGHRIEVAGTTSKSDEKMTGSASTSTTTSKDGGPISGGRLRVSSVRMISADCTAGQ